MPRIFVLCLLTLVGAAAAEPDANQIPSRIILTWSGDPSTTQNVTWRTGALLDVARAEIASLTANPDFAGDAKPVTATITRVELPGAKVAGHYQASFTRLKPDSQYCYRVGNGKIWSAWNVFRTAASAVSPFQFLYIGDAQNDIKSLWSRAIRMAYQKAPGARFVAMAGDLVAEGYDDRLWGELSEGFGFLSASTPLLPAPGNHDLHQADKTASYKAPSPWRQHFALPHNGPKGIDELDQQAYYVDYQGVRFVVVDANSFDSSEKTKPAGKERIRDAQVAWLESTLKNNPHKWTVVIQHQPVFPIAHGRGFPEMEKLLAPLYEKYKVALVLQGHDHSYGRMQKNGVTYIISVSGPKMYELDSIHLPKMAKTATDKQMFQVVDVTPARLSLKAYAIDGQLVDSVDVAARH